MNVDRQRILEWSLSALLFAAVLLLSLNRNFYTSSMTSLFLSLAMGSALVTLVMLRRSWRDLLWVAATAFGLAWIDYRILHFQPMFMAVFSFVGLAALVVLGTAAIWAQGRDRKLLLYGFFPAILFVASEYMATTLLDITEALHPKTLDLFLYSFDCSLHVQFSFLMGQVFFRHLWLYWACFVIYVALPLPLALVYAAQLRRQKEIAFQTMLAFLVTGPLGFFFYNVLPACGPVHLFGRAFPWHPFPIVAAAQLNVVPVLLKGARNAIPSLHMTWVLLVWWNSRGLPRWVRTIAAIFVIFTIMATLGTGEHYLVDLVVAFPFSLLVQALCWYSVPFDSGARRAAFLFGIFATLGWLALLSFATRLFWISPILPWTMIVSTIIPSILLWRGLGMTKQEQQPVRAMAVGASA